MARARVEPPSVEKYFELMCSPPVKIFVGPEAKQYTIPKDLLCFYSPFFVACFAEGRFREGIEGELHLEEECVEFFDVFLEYIRKGKSAVYEPAELSHYLRMKNPQRRLQLQNCIDFIKFCDRYDLGDLAGAVEGALAQLFKGGGSKHLEPEDVGDIAATTIDKSSNVYKLLMQASVREMLREAGNNALQDKFTNLMRQDDTVAAGMMREMIVMSPPDDAIGRVLGCPPLQAWKKGW